MRPGFCSGPLPARLCSTGRAKRGVCDERARQTVALQSLELDIAQVRARWGMVVVRPRRGVASFAGRFSTGAVYSRFPPGVARTPCVASSSRRHHGRRAPRARRAEASWARPGGLARAARPPFDAHGGRMAELRSPDERRVGTRYRTASPRRCKAPEPETALRAKTPPHAGMRNPSRPGAALTAGTDTARLTIVCALLCEPSRSSVRNKPSDGCTLRPC